MIEIKFTGRKNKKEKGETSTTKRVMVFLLGIALAFSLTVGGTLLSHSIWYNSGNQFGKAEGYIVEKNFDCELGGDNYIVLDNGKKYNVLKTDCWLSSLGDKVQVNWVKAHWFEYDAFIMEWLG